MRQFTQKACAADEEIDIEESSIAESGDDGGCSLSSRRATDAFNRLSISIEEGLLSAEVAMSVPLLLSDQQSNLRSFSARICPRGGINDFQQDPLSVGVQTKNFLEDAIETASLLCYLSVFGIIGVLVRYGLEVLFGPDVANVTHSNSALYFDLPANMVGCFFMGWVGVVFKPNIVQLSEHLAMGLSTGLMGSITTLSGWMQNMITLSAEGRWVVAFVGLLLGMELAQMSLLIGIETANASKTLINSYFGKGNPRFISSLAFLSKITFIVIVIILTVLLGGSIGLAILDFSSSTRHKIWLGCICGPFGVWMRWYLSRLNGQGIYMSGRTWLKWLPWGTLAANTMACCIMGGLSVIKLKVCNQNQVVVVEALQLGFLGCMSTVSTFVLEVHALHESKCPWRSYVYMFHTILLAFILETLIYSIPVWAKNMPQS